MAYGFCTSKGIHCGNFDSIKAIVLLLSSCESFIVGILRNTEPLDYSENHNFILTVRLHNCGLDPAQSDSIIINIKVTEACRPGWKGKRMSFITEYVTIYHNLTTANWFSTACIALFI